MERPYDLKEVAAQNSFVCFLLTVSRLNLSEEVDDLLWFPRSLELEHFFDRNRKYVAGLEEPKGILIL